MEQPGCPLQDTDPGPLQMGSVDPQEGQPGSHKSDQLSRKSYVDTQTLEALLLRGHGYLLFNEDATTGLAIALIGYLGVLETGL